MAIDTAAKRKSCIGIALSFLRPGVIPDGSNLSAAQRLHTTWMYSGIVASAPGGGTSIVVLQRAQQRMVFGGVFGRVN